MPKLKTHKGIKKRFKVSATGKVSHKRCGSSHLNEPQERQADPPAPQEEDREGRSRCAPPAPCRAREREGVSPAPSRPARLAGSEGCGEGGSRATEPAAAAQG